eukprot:TRINITY_DN3492_c7_g1_i2.p1 TRINITY_DN3492_c7_g1~~TRINITY_DN3492_c7_g1_i2.p1  ORF type:complete len:1069 (+),score=291.19 TRINITY_DN3492_c7_g1_i2:55-3207(+)
MPVSYEMAALLERRGLGDAADAEAGRSSWRKGADSRGPVATSPLDSTTNSVSRRASVVGVPVKHGSILNEAGALTEEYFERRRRTSVLLEAGVDPFVSQAPVPEWGREGAPEAPHSKRLSVLAVRGFRDIRGLPKGQTARLSDLHYSRAPGLSAKQIGRSPVSARRRLLDPPLKRQWKPLRDSMRPPPVSISPPPSRSSTGETFHQWYLRERRKEWALVEEEHFGALGTEADEADARRSLIDSYSDLVAFATLVVTPRANNQRRLSRALRYLTRHHADETVTEVSLYFVRTWVSEVWSSAQFATVHGFEWLTRVLVNYRHRPVRPPQQRAAATLSGIVFPLLDSVRHYRFLLPVLRELVHAVLTLVNRTSLRDLGGLVATSRKGLALILNTALRFASNERYLSLCLALTAKVADQQGAGNILVKQQGARWLFGVVNAVHSNNLSLRRGVAGVLLACAAADRACRPVLDQHGACFFLCDTLRKCVNPETEPSEDAVKTAAVTLDALLRFLSNPHDRACGSITHVMHGVLIPLRKSAALESRIDQVALRVRGAAPLITAHGLRAGADPLLNSLFRPFSEIELLYQVMPAEPPPPPPLPASALDSSQHRRDLLALPPLAPAGARHGTAEDGSLLYEATLNPPGEQVVTKCFFGLAGAVDCDTRRVFLSEIRLRSGLCHPCLTTLLCWSCRPCAPLLPGADHPEPPQTVYYAVLGCEGELFAEVARATMVKPAVASPRPPPPPLRILVGGLVASGDEVPEGLRLLTDCVDTWEPPSPPPPPPPGSLTYGCVIRAALDAADALRYLHASGCLHGDVSLRNLRILPSGRHQLLWPVPKSLPRDPLSAAAAARADVRGLGRLLAELLFLSSEPQLRLFLDILAAPRELPGVLINGVVARCFGRRLLGDLDMVSAPDEVETGAASPPCFSAAEAYAALQDCLLLSTLRREYEQTGGAGAMAAEVEGDFDGGDSLELFCKWVGDVQRPAPGSPRTAPSSPGVGSRSPPSSPVCGGVTTDDDFAVHFNFSPPGSLEETLRMWGCASVNDIPNIDSPLPWL